MPKQFVWDDKYSVKVPSLDDQHKKFFEITNSILSVLDNPSYSNSLDFINPNVTDMKKQLVLLVVELGNYALYHLNYEETCMKQFRCSGCEDHTQVHDIYREKTKIYLQQVIDENIDIYALAKEVAEFSQNWLSNHILSRDREYIECLKDKVKK